MIYTEKNIQLNIKVDHHYLKGYYCNLEGYCTNLEGYHHSQEVDHNGH
jgi:hypothetical protein